MSTYVPIQAITLSAGAGSVTFTGIPQTYTDLYLVINFNESSSTPQMTLRLNSDSGSNYSVTTLEGNGTNAVSQRQSNQAQMYIVGFQAGSFTAPYTNIVQFMNYSNTTTNKTVLSRNSANSAGAYCGLWRNTAAISTITLLPVGASTFGSGSTFTLYGVGSGSPKAFGGDRVVTDGTYWYHAFLSSGRFEPVQNISCDYLVVAGGGGGRNSGGGAGGFRTTTGVSLNASAYTVTVGAGGAGLSSSPTNGSNSSFNSFSATGGGAGVSDPNSGIAGGSGSGSALGSSGGAGNLGGYSPVEGYAGGASGYAGGGGGGGIGGNGSGTSTGGAGGVGAFTTLTNAMGSATSTGVLSSGNYYFAGGGGGCGSSAGGAGGLGGGGAGASGQAGAGVANTGGGGGGTYFGNPSFPANGGSGIVIIRYAV